MSIDISKVVIEMMKEKYNGKPGLVFETMNVKQMKYPPGQFNTIVDKGSNYRYFICFEITCLESTLFLSFLRLNNYLLIHEGTLDSLLCSDDADADAAAAVKEYSRLLSPGGSLVVISYGAPEARLHFLQQPGYNWSVKPVVTIGKFLYPGCSRVAMRCITLTAKLSCNPIS